MIRQAMIGAAVGLFASTALAASSDEDSQRAVVVERFAPFDKAAEDGWEPATPEPLYLAAGTEKPAAAPLTLQPGAYRIVVLCDCAQMAVTLLGPDNNALPPERSSQNAAMYSLDVRAAGSYLTGIDMDVCAYAQCQVGVRIYRKKS